MTAPLTAGFIPLVDAAPLIVAREIGFAEEEGLALTLRAAPSWATLRDLLALGQIEAAHLLAPIPVATALGLGGLGVRLDALSVLSLNGNVVGVSADTAQRLRQAGFTPDLADPREAGAALIGLGQQLRVGVPFPFSMHAELIYHWLGALGLSVPEALDIRTVPPPLMARAVADGEIDAFCVGEPWGSIAVETGVGELLLPGVAIWAAAPEKVLAVRREWAERERDLAERLIRAVWRAGRWLDAPGNRATAAEVLARPDYLNVPAEILDRSLTGQLSPAMRGTPRQVDRFVVFHEGAASFPWRSQAIWIGHRLATRTGLDRSESRAAAAEVFRSDLYRAALAPTRADLPGASEKVEGAIRAPMRVASKRGRLVLPADAFFDGTIFDPHAPD